MAITTKVETITPALAAEYLKKNTNNVRKLSRTVVNNYAEDIRNGRWQLNGETIVFAKNGDLKDGQQRLFAILKANKSIQCIVVRGIEDDVQIYDVGKRRTNSEIARSQGFECDNTLMAVSNIIVNQFAGRRNGTAVIDYAREHIDELTRAQRIAGNGANNSPSICAAYLMLRTNTMPSYEVELFFRLVNDFGFTHADGYEVSPALIAQRMFDERGSKRSGYQVQKERLEILILAMEDFHKGKKRELKYKISEPFHFSTLMNKVREDDGLEG
jgi:hypothetical protein